MLRKAHRIKVSGTAPPPPLRSFADLEAQPGCSKRLLRWGERRPAGHSSRPAFISGCLQRRQAPGGNSLLLCAQPSPLPPPSCPSCLARSNMVAAGFTEPTPIQRQAATALLGGRELLAIAPTGEGGRGWSRAGREQPG